MEHSALHRALGLERSPFTSEMLDDAIAQGIEEGDLLDWKQELPPEKALAASDFPKDVAAMANSGGGVIVYGVAEHQRAACGRVDMGQAVDEGYERTLRRVAVSNIHPPVFGLGVHPFGAEPERALIVSVPASVDGPHLMHHGVYFGAPVAESLGVV